MDNNQNIKLNNLIPVVILYLKCLFNKNFYYIIFKKLKLLVYVPS